METKKLNKKYLAAALKNQNLIQGFSANDEYNLAHFKTDWKHQSIVGKARWEQSGFQKLKLTKKQLMEYLRINGYEVV